MSSYLLDTTLAVSWQKILHDAITQPGYTEAARSLFSKQFTSALSLRILRILDLHPGSFMLRDSFTALGGVPLIHNPPIPARVQGGRPSSPGRTLYDSRGLQGTGERKEGYNKLIYIRTFFLPSCEKTCLHFALVTGREFEYYL
jgi:hypothetical protein